MKLGDIIRLQVNPVTGYEIDPAELVPNGKWVEVSDGEYEQRGLVKDIIGTSIRMRQLLPSKYRVNVLANTDGWGSGVIEGTTVGSGEYYLGEIVSIGAIANHGFEFTHWQDGETETPREVRVVGDMDFVANFRHKKSTYTVQVVIKPGQELFGTVSGGGTGLQYGERIHISAIPHNGYAFAGWTDGYTQRERDVTVTGDQTYIAQFTPKRHNITVKSEDPTKGYATGGGVFDHGSTIHISAGVIDPNCIFDRWSDGVQAPERDIEVLGDAEYIARFTDIPQTEVKIYVLTEDEIKGYTDPSGSVICRIGDELLIGAFARAGYQFKAWDDGNEQRVRTISVTGNATYTALFKPKTTQYYTLEILCDPEEGGWVNSEGGAATEFPEGTVLHIEAIPNDGYEFDEWELNGEPYSSNRGITITLDGNKTLTAKFNELPELPKYTISTICAEGEGETFGDGEYEQGSPCKVVARAADGYHFVGWTEDGVVVSTSEGYDFTVECDRVLTAEFEMNADETHNVSIVIVTNDDPNDYAGGAATGGGQYLDGSTCTIHARCADNTYEFVGWAFDDINGELIKPMDYSFTVTHDTVIYAKFRTYVTPTFNVVTGTNPAELANTTGDGTYDKDTLVTVEIDISSIASQYEFIGWEINGIFHEASSEEDNTYTFAVVRNTEAIAILKLREVTEYNITTDVNPDDCGYVNGGGTYNAGTTCELTAVPAEGYQFVNWTENGEVVDDSYIYQFVVNRNRTLVANFEQLGYTINASARPDDYGTVEGADTYMYGETCILKANANIGYKFINWTENGVEVSIEPTYSFEVRGNRSLIANFTGSTPSDYVISANTDPRNGGTITGAGTYTYGQTCILTATPAAGYEFDCWEEDDTEIVGGATLEFTVTGNRSLTAKFTQSVPTSYTINATANPAEGGSVSGGDAYAPGVTCTLTATANNGYKFVSWKEGNVVQSTNPTYSFTVAGNRSLTAIFEQISYTINASARPSGYGTVEGADTYTYGETCTLKANANIGYKFVNWTEDGVEVSTDPTYQFTVTEDRSLIANFTGSTPSDYTISATTNPRNGGSITGAGTYTYGQTCTLIATPAEGYEFDHWEENDTEIVGGATLEFTVTSNRSLTAKFIQSTPTSYTINATANPAEGGSVSGGDTYTPGVTCTLTATANNGYRFVSWKEGNVVQSTNPTYSFTVAGNRSLTAIFEQISYTINASARPTEYGTVEGADTYTYGETCTLKATANSGYKFVNWTENGVEVSTNPTYQFTVTENRSLIANFTGSTPSDYTISATADPSNGGSITGAGTYTHGQTCTLIATPAEGYEFDCWEENGTEIVGGATLEFTVTSNRSLTAKFTQSTQTQFTIITESDPTEGGNTRGGGTFDSGDEITIVATPATGYDFVNWTVNGTQVSTNASYTFNVNRNQTVVAHFTKQATPQFTITTESDPTEGGSTSGGGTFDSGDEITIVATPAAGYDFVNWTVNDVPVSTNASYTFNVNRNQTVVAHFTKQATPQFTITTESDPTEGGSTSGGGTFDSGDEITIVATPAAGYDFVNWTVNGTQVSTNASYTFNVNRNQTVVAHFTKQATPQFTITTESDPTEGGSTSGGGTFDSGDEITIVATPAAGYDFVNWTVNGTQVSTNASYTFNVNRNQTVVAHFTKQATPQFTITTESDPTEGGNTRGGGTFDSGDEITIVATPATGYDFVNWTVNDVPVSTNASYTFNVNRNQTVVAHFTKQATPQFTITTESDPTEGGSTSGGGTFDSGDEITIVATPATGYDFVNWTVNDVPVSTNASYTFNVNRNQTVVAHFAKQATPQFTITTESDPTEGGSTSGGGTFDSGDEITIVATPATGYDFVNWTVNGTQVSTNASYTFNVNRNQTVVAHFTKQATPQFTITTESDPTEGGSTSGGGTFDSGDEITIVATPAAGYDFVNWTVNDTPVSTNASYTFEVTRNQTVVAHFTKQATPQFTITTESDPTEGGDTRGGGTFDSGDEITIVATPAAGYDFVNWTVNDTPVSTNASYTFEVTRNQTVVAHFTKQATPQFTITTESDPTEGGSTSGGGTFDSGDEITIVATPATGYDFVNWTVNDTPVSTNASYTFEVTRNQTVVAHFTKQATPQFTITTESDPTEGGSTSGDGTYDSGSRATVVAVPATGYDFVNWTVNDTQVSTDASYTFEVTRNQTVVAHFTKQATPQFTITTESDPTEGGDTRGGGTFDSGDEITIVATPATGYDFVNWTVNGTQVSTNASYTFNVNRNQTVVAHFTKQATPQFTITTESDPTEGGSTSGDGTYDAGSRATIVATPATGYDFVNWTVNDVPVSTEASYTFEVTRNQTVVAHFTESVHDYSQDYLTIRVVDDGTLKWAGIGGSDKTIQYSIDGGEWTSIRSSDNVSVPVTTGQVIRIKGTNTNYATSKTAYSAFQGGTAKYNVEGNIMSLIYGDNFVGQTRLTNDWAFANLFNGDTANASNVISAEHLILPATQMSKHCYRAMFANCPLLTTPPVLPATVLTQRCYSYMFDNCPLLASAPELLAPILVIECYYGMFHMSTGTNQVDYIKCLAISGFDTTNCLNSWVQGVASTGTFIKDANAEISVNAWKRGTSGIPNGWTVKDNEDDRIDGGDTSGDDPTNDDPTNGETGRD